MDDEARQNLKESFAADMAESQRLAGKMPTPVENARLAVPMFEMLEQKQANRAVADDFGRDPMPDDEAHQAAIRSEVERRGRAGAADRFSIQRMPDKAPVRVKASRADLERGRRMQRRLDELLAMVERGPFNSPSWAERVQAVLVLRFVVGLDHRRKIAELLELLAASEAVLGPWDVPEGEGRPLIFAP